MREAALLSEELVSAAVGVLGSMLLDGETVGPMLLAVEEKDFRQPELRNLFLAIRELYQQGRPIDRIVVNEHLGGGYDKIMGQIIEVTPTAANAEAYAAALKKSSRLWQLREIGDQLSQAADEADAGELVDRANLLFCQRAGVKRLTMEEGFRDFFKRHGQLQGLDYLKWGLGPLDEELHVGGGDMVVIGGYPSAGKTAFALQIAFHIAGKKRVGFFSYETAADKLHDRTVACQTQTSFRRMMAGTLECGDYGRVKDMRGHLTAPVMDLVEASGMAVSGIGAYAMAYHYDVIVVDYLQKIPAARSGRYLSDFERVSQVSDSLQQLGRRTGKTIIALSQLSRLEKGQKAPTMSSLRQSGQIEQDADVVMLLYKEYPDMPYSRRLLDVAKNKDGESSLHMLLNFDGDKQRFSRAVGQPASPAKPEPPAQQSIFRPLPDNTASPFDREAENRRTKS